MIVVSGTALSRAWCAVSLAAAEDEARPILYRTVLVEEYEGAGLRLTSTDSYWLAQCWVPAEGIEVDDFGFTDPGFDVVPDEVAIVRDDERRVRDLMRHVTRLTREDCPFDVAVQVHINRDLPDMDHPALPGIEQLTASFELPGREVVIATVLDGLEFPNWRPLIDGALRAGPGVTQTILSGWLIAALAKIPRIVGSEHLELHWPSNRVARWIVTDGRLANRPHGVLMAIRPANETAGDKTVAADGETSPGEQRLAAL